LKEIVKLIEFRTGQWIYMRDNPKGRVSAYYTSWCRTNIKDSVLVHRVRGTSGGDQIDFDGNTAVYTASMQTFTSYSIA
jgi:hypothetical protein